MKHLEEFTALHTAQLHQGEVGVEKRLTGAVNEAIKLADADVLRLVQAFAALISVTGQSVRVAQPEDLSRLVDENNTHNLDFV